MRHAWLCLRPALMSRIGPTVLAVAGLLLGEPAHAAAAVDRPTRLSQLVAGDAEGPCPAAMETLERVTCRKEIRVGVRADYPPFGQSTPDGPQGFEPALARLLAERMGVDIRFVEVSAADRMVVLGEDRVDMLIATTGHTVQRDEQALFVRPHYFESHTVVVGQRDAALHAVNSLDALAGHTVCVTIGNSTNADLAVHGARLMLFSSARRLVEQIQNGTCPLAAHDDSLLLPLLPRHYEVKLSFAPLPWGIVVNRRSSSLAQLLARELRWLHRDGTLLRLARQHGVGMPWLMSQQVRWSAPPCNAASAPDDPACVDPPRDNRLAPTAVAGAAEALERWLQATWKLDITLAMLKTQVAWRLFLEGVGYSLALVAGAVLATVLLALGFGAGLCARSRWLRWPLWCVLQVVQSTPMVMFMAAAGMLLSSAGLVTPVMAWAVAVVVLGLFNGSNAGQAVAEARRHLRDAGRPAGLLAAALHARAQIASFAANATRGSPVASLIGVPELLAAQTDIASFSAESTTTFGLLLIFYMALVSLVVALLKRVQARLQPYAT
ncbi:ABC-type amino acid transport substrate-binding protein [Roseateles sp. YR242]|uniref:transporter substrate-binding domain-containing protein n=1 Tax=Roseateles sp. YR242 TaxID=1855305 RepID=UPI0008BF54E9|nr:transporter substrate-binding domain-containing protein [Roseateles sp. YR242]SEL87709.1 ABC-type amino acid transport substrate-binding protein [Roseateles sp. YR242]